MMAKSLPFQNESSSTTVLGKHVHEVSSFNEMLLYLSKNTTTLGIIYSSPKGQHKKSHISHHQSSLYTIARDNHPSATLVLHIQHKCSLDEDFYNKNAMWDHCTLETLPMKHYTSIHHQILSKHQKNRKPKNSHYKLTSNMFYPPST